MDDWRAWVALDIKPPTATVITVRRDWRDGTHDLQGQFETEDEALAQVKRDSTRLRENRAAEEPTHNVLWVTEQVYQDHQDARRCASIECPQARPRTPEGAVLIDGEAL
jgi:hypothetical protein